MRFSVPLSLETQERSNGHMFANSDGKPSRWHNPDTVVARLREGMRRAYGFWIGIGLVLRLV